MVAFSIQGSFKKTTRIEPFYKMSVEIYSNNNDDIFCILRNNAAHLLNRYEMVNVIVTKTSNPSFVLGESYFCVFNPYKLNLGVKEVMFKNMRP